MNNDTKTNVQYATAIGTLISGIIMCFLSFFLNKYMIESSVLMYFGEGLVFCAGVFGLNLVIKNKIMEAETRINNKIEKEIQKANSSNTDKQNCYLDFYNNICVFPKKYIAFLIIVLRCKITTIFLSNFYLIFI